MKLYIRGCKNKNAKAQKLDKIQFVLKLNKGDNMKKLFLTLLVLSGVVWAFEYSYKSGNTLMNSDGSYTTKSGNMYFNSDGSYSVESGNMYHHSDGGYSGRSGNMYFHSDKNAKERTEDILKYDWE